MDQNKYLQSQITILNQKIAMIKDAKINDSKLAAKKVEEAKVIQASL